MAAAVLAAAGCGATFDVTQKSSTTVPGGGLLQNLASGAFGDFTSLDLSSSQEFKNQGVSKDQVDSVKIKRFSLAVTSPPDGTLEFLDRIAFSVTADGQTTRRVAHKDSIPDAARTVDLDLDGVELAPYVTAPKMSLTTDSTAHAPSRDTVLEATVVFTVEPNIF